MKVAGIIAEYNPFHNGHAFLAEKARKAGFSNVVAVMSGNFVQRGEPALMHHSVRTRAALECGVDLVLQLPAVYAASGAQSFAQAGVRILDRLGCVDALVFGSECGDTEKIVSAASLIYGEKIKPIISEELEKGITFASARENALRKLNGEYADIIQSPNNILGVEYAAALERIGSSIMPITYGRAGVSHDSDCEAGGFASASLIRDKIRAGESVEALVPAKAAEIYKKSDIADIGEIENAILYKMRTVTAEELAKTPDVSEGIENRIISAAKQATNLNELYMLAKTKRYTHARIRRIILNCFLNVTAEDLQIPAPYIRVTGFNERGAQIIRAAKDTATLPVITKAADLARLDESAQRIFLLECMAGDVYSLCIKNRMPCGVEKDFRPIIIQR